jgi:Protein of unknown function (DUF3352)
MRRVVLLLSLCALAVAGCGSSSTGASNPVNAELSYFPASSPFVMSVVTDPNSPAVHNAHALIARFPIAAYGESALMAKLDQSGIDYQNDIRPLFGNPVLLGAAGPGVSTSSAASSFLGVWVAKDAGKLSALIKKIPGLHKAGSHDGATLYQVKGSTTFAVNGPTIVIGASPTAVDSALDRHAHGGGITGSQYAEALAGLPQNSLIEAFGNLAGVLSAPGAAKARQVPWVAALRGYAFTVTANSSGLSFDYHLDTTGGSLTSAQVPLTTSSAQPSLAGAQPITVGIEDPAHILAFAESVEQQTSPSGYAKFKKRQAAVRAKTGVDLNSLLKLATGSLIIASNTHSTMGRVGVSNPSAAASTLSKLMTLPRAVFARATHVTRLDGGFYAIRESGQTITVGVVGSQLLLGKATPAQLRGFAAAPASPAPGAQGSLAFRIALAELVDLGLRHFPGQVGIAQNIFRSLGDITGSTAASPAGITGRATLAVR